MIVKVCGMREALNIRLVEQLPIDWMGFIFYPPSSRYVDKVPEYLPQGARRVGVFVNADEDFIDKRRLEFNLDIIQLHGDETPDFCKKIKQRTHCPIIKAFGIKDDTDFSTIHAYKDVADYFLFDTYCKSAGGSGKSFNHQLLDKYKGNTPFLLSGGLGPSSIDEINQFQHPQYIGIDLNSCFEISPALKSVGLLKTFLQKINQNKENNKSL